jgi:hypothetical protein
MLTMMKIDSTDAFSSQAGVPARRAAPPATDGADGVDGRVAPVAAAGVSAAGFANAPVAVFATEPAFGSTCSESADFLPAYDGCPDVLRFLCRFITSMITKRSRVGVMCVPSTFNSRKTRLPSSSRATSDVYGVWR